MRISRKLINDFIKRRKVSVTALVKLPAAEHILVFIYTRGTAHNQIIEIKLQFSELEFLPQLKMIREKRKHPV